MELGEGRLLRAGLNALYQAVHPVCGLAWTNGTRVFLTDLQLHSGEATFGDSRAIGQSGHICGLSWAPPAAARVPALLAVQHKRHVAVWQVCPSTAGSGTWLVSLASEIRESLPLLPQGSVWHPRDTVLTVLTAQTVSVVPDAQRDGSQVKVDLSTQGRRVHCACWTQDGQRLVVAVGSSLHSYIWDSAHKTLHRCSFCPVFDLDSTICSIRATVGSQVAIATELPLDKICSLNASEAFDVPPDSEDTCLHTFPVIGEMPVVDKGTLDSEIAVSPSFSDLLDLTHIRLSPSRSEGNSLICLRKKDYLTGTGQDSSHLVFVTFKEALTTTRKVIIPGLLVPDLIAVHLKAQVVAVASNTCNIILIYSVMPSSMPNIQQIHLESNERPKGICFLEDKLLILVGKQKSADTAFLPSAQSDQYFIQLIVKEVMLKEESSVTANENQSAASTHSALLNNPSKNKLIESLSPYFCLQNRDPLLTANTSSWNGRPGRTFIQEIKSHPSSISHGPITLETLDRPGRTPDPSNAPEPSDSPQRENLQKEKEAYQLSKKLETLSRNLAELQQCLPELMDFLRKGKKSSPAYPLSKDLPYVCVVCQKPCYVDPVEKRLVLLCDGKLRLSTVQQLFGLSLVEMLHGSQWILLSADHEGFIPVTFTAAEVVTVRDGIKSQSNVFRDSFLMSGSFSFS